MVEDGEETDLRRLVEEATANIDDRCTMLNTILNMISIPEKLQPYSERISCAAIGNLAVAVAKDSKSAEAFYSVLERFMTLPTFNFMVSTQDLQDVCYVELVANFSEATGTSYGLFYAMLMRIISRVKLAESVLQREFSVDHSAALLSLSDRYTAEEGEHALAALQNLIKNSNALLVLLERDPSIIARCVNIILHGNNLCRQRGLAILTQIVYKSPERKKAASESSLGLLPYVVQSLHDQNDSELQRKATKLLVGLAEVPANKDSFMMPTSSTYVLPLILQFSAVGAGAELQANAWLILWTLAKDHPANQITLLGEDIALMARLKALFEQPLLSSRANALGLLAVLFENATIADRLLDQTELFRLVMNIASHDSIETVRINALIVITKALDYAAWKDIVMLEVGDFIEQLLNTVQRDDLLTCRGHALRILFILANDFPAVAQKTFADASALLSVLDRDTSSSNRFKLLQLLAAQMENVDNQKLLRLANPNVAPEPEGLLHRILFTIVRIIAPSLSSSTETNNTVSTMSSQQSIRIQAMAIDVLRALVDGNPSMQSLLFYAAPSVPVLKALIFVLNQPGVISGNHDPKVVALRVLFTLANHRDLKLQLLSTERDLLPPILKIIIEQPAENNDRAKIYAAGTLFRFVQHNVDNQFLFAQREYAVLPALVTAIRNPATSWKAKEFLVSTVVQIAKLPANYWVAFDRDLSLFATTFQLLQDTYSGMSNSTKGCTSEDTRFYLLGVLEDLCEAYDISSHSTSSSSTSSSASASADDHHESASGSEATFLDHSQRLALVKQLHEIVQGPTVTVTKARALRLLLLLSMDTGHVISLPANADGTLQPRLDLLPLLLAFLRQICEPLLSVTLPSVTTSSDMEPYKCLQCVFQFTTGKRIKQLFACLTLVHLQLLPSLHTILSRAHRTNLNNVHHGSTKATAEERLVANILWNLAENGDERMSEELVKHGLHLQATSLLRTLMTQQDVGDFQTPLLNMLMNMARYFSVRQALLSAGAVEIATRLLAYQTRPPGQMDSMIASELRETSGMSSSASAGVNSTSNNSGNGSSSSAADNSSSNPPTNALKASLILLFLFGNKEKVVHSLLSASPTEVDPSSFVTEARLRVLMEIFAQTLQCRGGKDYALGTFCLPLLVHASLVISQSDSNKATLVQLGVVPLLTRTLRLFVSHQPAIPYCGGGGRDDDTARMALETLVQLSFLYPDNRTLQISLLGSHSQNAVLLEVLSALSQHTRLEEDARNRASFLLHRVTSHDLTLATSALSAAGLATTTTSTTSADPVDGLEPRLTSSSAVMDGVLTVTTSNATVESGMDLRRVSSLESSSAALPSEEESGFITQSLRSIERPPRHVMLSYAWHSSARPEIVEQLGAELRRCGIDVWRDREGSSLLPPLIGGSFNDSISAVIEQSHTLIVCVSPAYKLSINCHVEADYASVRAKQGKLRLVFVMLSEDYTTVSSPEHCDGWLGLIIGASVWHPLWHPDMVRDVAVRLARDLPPETRRVHHRSSQPRRISSPRRVLLINGAGNSSTTCVAIAIAALLAGMISTFMSVMVSSVGFTVPPPTVPVIEEDNGTLPRAASSLPPRILPASDVSTEMGDQDDLGETVAPEPEETNEVENHTEPATTVVHEHSDSEVSAAMMTSFDEPSFTYDTLPPSYAAYSFDSSTNSASSSVVAPGDDPHYVIPSIDEIYIRAPKVKVQQTTSGTSAAGADSESGSPRIPLAANKSTWAASAPAASPWTRQLPSRRHSAAASLFQSVPSVENRNPRVGVSGSSSGMEVVPVSAASTASTGTSSEEIDRDASHAASTHPVSDVAATPASSRSPHDLNPILHSMRRFSASPSVPLTTPTPFNHKQHQRSYSLSRSVVTQLQKQRYHEQQQEAHSHLNTTSASWSIPVVEHDSHTPQSTTSTQQHPLLFTPQHTQEHSEHQLPHSHPHPHRHPSHDCQPPQDILVVPRPSSASTTSASVPFIAEDRHTEITAEEDDEDEDDTNHDDDEDIRAMLKTAWRLLQCLELVKNRHGLHEYLYEEGIRSAVLLGCCEPEDWLHAASFLRNKPKKRFMDLMHQVHAGRQDRAQRKLQPQEQLPQQALVESDHYPNGPDEQQSTIATRTGSHQQAGMAETSKGGSNFLMCNGPEACIIS